MKAFVSHTYFTDDTLAHCLYKAFELQGIGCYNHEKLSMRLKVIHAGGSDLDDLINAYRLGGRPGPTQEVSDQWLHTFLVEEIAKQDVVVILWSEQYGQKFWTQREMRTALARGIRIVVIMMEVCSLDRELQKGVQSGLIPIFQFGKDFDPKDVCAAILSMDVLPLSRQPEKTLDKGLNHTFLRIEHPSLGTYEIAESYFTWTDMKRFEIKRPPAEFKQMDIGDNVSSEYINSFCQHISQHSPYYKYRLPTESEWEFAARAGSSAIHTWISDSEVDRDGAPAIRNAWDMWFAPKAFEWTSTKSEWHEYFGWVQPINIVEKQLGPDRSNIVKRINDGPGGKSGYYPLLVHKGKEEPRLGFRLIRERRKDINMDVVLPTGHRNLAQELLLISDPEKQRTSIRQMFEYGTINRYFRAYLEDCALKGSWKLAEPLLVAILMVVYVPPVSLPPYLHEFFHQSLSGVFDTEKPDIAISILLDRLEKMNLLGREFAEVLMYDFGRKLAFESCWQACLSRIPEKEKELVFRFCG